MTLAVQVLSEELTPVESAPLKGLAPAMYQAPKEEMTPAAKLGVLWEGPAIVVEQVP